MSSVHSQPSTQASLTSNKSLQGKKSDHAPKSRQSGKVRAKNSKGSADVDGTNQPRVKKTGRNSNLRAKNSKGSGVRAKKSGGKKEGDSKVRVRKSKGRQPDCDDSKRERSKASALTARALSKSSSSAERKKAGSSLSASDVGHKYYQGLKVNSQVSLKPEDNPAMKEVRIDSKGWPRGTRSDGVDYCSFLDRHFEDCRPGVNKITYSEKELDGIITDATRTFKEEPLLIDIEPPVTIVGDIHGQFNDLINMFALLDIPPYTKYVFLGDYVDRGLMSLEVIFLLLAYKVIYPQSITLLRGNHECARINRNYGFLTECKTMFGAEKGLNIWQRLQKCFDEMPVCAVIGTKIMCMHGGLTPELENLDDLRQMQKPVKNPSHGLVNDMLWSDPDPNTNGWKRSTRGSGFFFGTKAIQEMCDRLDVDLIVRAHQLCLDGYYIIPSFYLITIFSAPMYCGLYRSCASYLQVDEELRIQFVLAIPEIKGVRKMICEQNASFNNYDKIKAPWRCLEGRRTKDGDTPEAKKAKEREQKEKYLKQFFFLSEEQEAAKNMTEEQKTQLVDDHLYDVIQTSLKNSKERKRMIEVMKKEKKQEEKQSEKEE